MALLLQAGCVWSVGTCINEPLEMMRMGCVPCTTIPSFPHPLQSTLSCILPSRCAQISPVFYEKQISSESTFRMVLISGQSLYLLSPLATGGSILPSVGCWVMAQSLLAFTSAQCVTSGQFRLSQCSPWWWFFFFFATITRAHRSLASYCIFGIFLYVPHAEWITAARVHFHWNVKSSAVIHSVCPCSFF